MIDFHRHIHLPFPTNPSFTYWYATSRVSEYALYEGENHHYHGYGYLYEEEEPTIESIIEKHLIQDSLGYIGEVGIDTHFSHILSLEKQLEVVYSLTKIAISYSRPIVFHITSSLELMDDIFKVGKDRVTMIIHHFTGSVETAHQLYKKGVYVSLGPRVWQKEMNLSKRMDELNIPILLETDYTGNIEIQYKKLIKNHYRWYEREKDIEHNTLVEKMHELSSVFQSHPIIR